MAFLPRYNRVEEIRKIEGSGFGCPIYGFFDPIINLLQKLLVLSLPIEFNSV
jgi:hypothetical protein